jgi:tRNA pseudouridine55 synthase
LAAGSRGHLAGLERRRVAGFDLADAVSMDSPDLAAALRPIAPETFDALGLPWEQVDEEAAAWLRQGKPPDRLPVLRSFQRGAEPKSLALFCGDSFVALMRGQAGGGWSYGYVHADP